MAINQNPQLPARNCLIIGTTGAGKSQAVKNLVPGKGVRVLGFDPDSDHKLHQFSTGQQWAREVIKAVKSGRPFRLGWCDGTQAAQFEQFCAGVWDVLDGKHTTHVICEEAAQFCRSSGPADEHLGNLMRRGRKYGALVYVLGQRAAEIPTTARNLCSVRYVGRCEPDDYKAAAKLVGVTEQDIADLETVPRVNGHLPPVFWRKEAGEKPELVTFKYIK